VSFGSIDALEVALGEQGYLPDRGLATALYLSLTLDKPLLLEGEAGVGKTEAAKAVAAALGARLIRLQCYEGLDASTALYEWNYPKQILRIRLEERDERPVSAKEADIFSETFLLKRPLLQAITQADRAPVLLIDEIDRADVEFESFLLEVLSDFQVTVPEIGTITAAHRPDVVLTSNRSRDLSDALRRRCLYLWIDYPSFEKEVRILRTKVPGINERLAGQIARVMQNLRRRQLQKVPGVAESLDWGAALVALHADHLDAELVRETLGCVLKEVDDVKRIEADLAAGRLSELLEG
jgi:MoxR-like ATPase